MCVNLENSMRANVVVVATACVLSFDRRDRLHTRAPFSIHDRVDCVWGLGADIQIDRVTALCVRVR